MPGIDGITKEHDEFVASRCRSDDVLDMFLTGAASRTEHYEIAAYSGLITMAEGLGENKAAALLRKISSRNKPRSNHHIDREDWPSQHPPAPDGWHGAPRSASRPGADPCAGAGLASRATAGTQ